MKIVIPNFSSPDSFVDNVAHTLRQMNHDVITSSVEGPKSKLGFAFNEFRLKAFPDRWTKAEQWVVKQARDHKPDIVLCLTQSLRQEVLDELRRTGVRKLLAWWGDSPANMRGLGLLADGWDAIFLKDAAAVAKLRSVGLPAELLHEAMNPDWHRRSFNSVNGDLIVAGNYYGFRQFLLLRLIDAQVPMALYGFAPPRWADPRIKSAHRHRYLIKAEKSMVFGSGLACLNSTSLSEGDSLNCRAFEIAGACGLQLIEDRPAVQTCFEPGREVLVYRSVPELLDHLARARREPQWAEEVREAGHRRAHAEHTYAQRLTYAFRYVGLAA